MAALVRPALLVRKPLVGRNDISVPRGGAGASSQ